MSLTFSADGAWNLGTSITIAIAFYYSYGIWSTFRGGKLDRAYAYLLCGLAVMLVAFVVRFAFDLANITPIDAYYVSVRDCGVLIAIALFAMSARDLGRFWKGDSR